LKIFKTIDFKFKTLIQKLEKVFPPPIVNSPQTVSTVRNLFSGIFPLPAQDPSLLAQRDPSRVVSLLRLPKAPPPLPGAPLLHTPLSVVLPCLVVEEMKRQATAFIPP
jgi:hypothetical protein